MATNYLDQVVWKNLTVTTGGVTAAYVYGDLLPAASTDADLATRAALRSGGAIRGVTQGTVAADFYTAAAAAGTKQAAREAELTGTTAAKAVLSTGQGFFIPSA